MIKQNRHFENLLVSKTHLVQISVYYNYMGRVNWTEWVFATKRKKKKQTNKQINKQTNKNKKTNKKNQPKKKKKTRLFSM